MATQHEFKTEVKQMLDLVINSLYSNKEIFLREIISNASDAIDRARFEALKDTELLEGDSTWKIKLIVDKAAKTLTVSDNGIGMTPEEVEKNIGTVANSGTKKFLDTLAANKEKLPPELIGQFGVGFYSAFMVADEVTVITRRHGAANTATKWVSKGDGYYTVEAAEKATRGTDVIMTLKEDAAEFLDEWKLRKIVKKYSDFVEHPIAMDVTKSEPVLDAEGKPVLGEDGKPVPPTQVTKEETLNSQKAIWLRAKNEIKEEEYAEFYKHISHDFQSPFETVHWSVEGQTEFKALVYIPQKPIWDMFMPDQRSRGLQLYVRRVFITDTCEELLPHYLRFLRGVVDSSDLPLNVSREMLQEARSLQLIRKNIVKKILDTLAEYVKRMPEAQKEIYYLTADKLEAAKNSPQLEVFRKKGYEVLFLTDPVDEFVIPSIESYQDKTLRDISKGDVDLETDEEKKASEEARKTAEADNKDLVAKLGELLKEQVKEVKLSNRLTDSACCLVDDMWSMSPQMIKMMKAMKQEVPESKQILEINPSHPLIIAMRKALAADAANPKLASYAKMLFDSARLTSNQAIDDPLAFAKQLAELMAESI